MIPSGDDRSDTTVPASGRLVDQCRRRWSTLVLVLLAYVPLLCARPGRLVADTKLYLYLDPGRLIGDAALSWDSRQFGGWVPHQIVAYLWPQGPWYWSFAQLGVPTWVAHRLWVGTVLVMGGLGLRWMARSLGLATSAATVAAVAYQCSPYVLPYVSRTSAMLLPWAALGWVVGLTMRAASGRTPWRHAALLALVVGSCSAVNTTAILMIAPAPAIWLLDAASRRVIAWRRVAGTAARVALLCLGTCAWWIVMVRTQGAYGADLLGFSESIQATSFTSASTEVLRGMGYWLFYVRDPFAFTTTAGGTFMTSPVLIALTFVVLVAGLTGLVIARWSHRRYLALLVLVGTVLAVGVHPIDDPSPLMEPLAGRSRSFLALALRSSTRATPLVVAGLALGLGALVTVATARLAARAPRRAEWAVALPILVLVASNPALLDGDLVDPALVRNQPPKAWTDAGDALSAGDTGARVWQLPGAEFGAFDWGYAVDPPLPGLTTKPLLTRDLLPLGSAGLEDLSYALDDRFQDGVVEPASLAAVARVLGVDTIWLAGDLAFDRFRNPWPADSLAVLSAAQGLRAGRSFGPEEVASPTVDMVDEHLYAGSRPDLAALPTVVLFSVDDPVPVARTITGVVLLAGSGDGVIDAAAAGLLHGDEAVIYAAHVADGSVTLHGEPTLVVLTDSNRDRAHHWRSSQDVSGFTETGGSGSDLLEVDESDRRLPVFGDSPDPSQQTIAVLDGLSVWASGYGEPFAHRPEDRPAMAVDGDLATAWLVGDRADPIGQRIRVSSTDGGLDLTQSQDATATRVITRIEVLEDGRPPMAVELGAKSLSADGQHVALAGTGPVTITITAIGPRSGGTDSGPTAVGFAELGIGAHPEWVRLPALPAQATSAPRTAVVLTRLRVDPLDRWRSDPEPVLRREFDVPDRGDWSMSVMLRLHATASDEVLSGVTGLVGAIADRRLHGSPAAAGVSAVDGDPDTAWTTPFGDVLGATLTVDTVGPVDRVTLTQAADGRHSTITELELRDDLGTMRVPVPSPDEAGNSRLAFPRPTTGDRLSLVITGIDASTTTDRRYGEQVTLPAAVVELESPGLAGVTARSLDAGCRTDLLEVDGTPIGVGLDGPSLAALARGEAVTADVCTTWRPDAGTHRLVSAPGASTGLDVDRVTMTAGVDAALQAAPTTSTVQRVEVIGQGTERTLRVPACPDGCWVVWGEGHNTGWSADVDGTSLGAPSPVDASNAWWLSPRTTATDVHLRWRPQRAVGVALGVSAATALLCALLVAVRRKRHGDDRAHDDVAQFHTASPEPVVLVAPLLEASSRRAAAVGGATLVVLAGALVTPLAALVMAPVAMVVVATRRLRALGAVAPVVAAAVGAYMTLRQATEHIAANAAWVTAWDRVHRPGLVIVLVLAVSTFSDPLAERSAATRPPRTGTVPPAA